MAHDVTKQSEDSLKYRLLVMDAFYRRRYILTKEERVLIRMRYAIQTNRKLYTFKEIGVRVGKRSPERARQLVHRAESKLEIVIPQDFYSEAVAPSSPTKKTCTIRNRDKKEPCQRCRDDLMLLEFRDRIKEIGNEKLLEDFNAIAKYVLHSAHWGGQYPDQNGCGEANAGDSDGK